MEKAALEQWAKLYHFTREVSAYEPWERFRENDAFVYVQKETKTELVFAILGNECPFCGIACYNGWMEYSKAMLRLREENRKQEPQFMLQNAMIGIWGARKDVSKANYAIIKELGLRGHGDGSWLYFEKYREGYAPTELSDAEVETLADAMGNLFMMMRAVYEDRLPEYKPGMMLVRWFDEKIKLYATHPFPMQKLAKPNYPSIQVEENEHFQSVKALPAAACTVSLDWSYLPFTVKEEGQEFFPRLLLGIDQNEMILVNGLLSIDDNQVNMVFNAMEDLFRTVGRPKTIKLCDRELEAILSDFCRKLGIRVSYTKNLPALNRVRKMLVDDMSK